MKQSPQIVRRLGAGLLLIAVSAIVLLLSDWQRGKKPAASLPRVAVFQYSSQAILEEGIRGLLDALRDHGYEDGRTMQLRMFNAENDLPTANSIARELTGGRFDYVFTVSTNCLQAVAKANRDGRVKHVFGVVANPVEAGVGINPKDPLDHPKNMVGIGTLVPVGDLLEVAKRMNPRLRRVGLPWNPSQSNSETYTRMGRAAAPRLGIELLEGTVETTPAVGEVVASLVARGAEAILTTGDLTVTLAIDTVIAEANRGGVPVFSTQPVLAARGVLLAMGADYYLIGRETGDLAARVLGGEDPSRSPILYRLPKMVTINRAPIGKLKDAWTFPPDLLAVAKEATSAPSKTPDAPAPLLKKWKIHLVQLADSPVLDECRQGVLQGFREAGLVQGRDYDLTWRSAHGDMPTLNGILDAAVTEQADMVFTLSTPALQAAMQKIRDRPVLFALSLDPLLIGDRGTHSSHRANVAGIYSRSPFEGMMKLIKESLPAAQSIGTLFAPAEANSVNHREELEKAAREAGLRVVALPANSPVEVADAAVALTQRGIDAVCQINDNLHSAAFPSIIAAARRARLPVFSFLSTQANQGASLVLANDHFDGGRESALLAAQVMRGASPARFPYRGITKTRLVANPRAALEVNLKIPEQVLRRAEVLDAK